MSKQEAAWSQEYGEYVITITADGRFTFTDKDGDQHVFDTVRLAQEKCDRLDKAEEASRRVKLDVACFDSDGKNFKVTGVHGGNGSVLTSPPNMIGKWGGKKFYIDTPASREALDVFNAASKALKEASEKLDAHRVTYEPGYRDGHEQRVQKLNEAIECARKCQGA